MPIPVKVADLVPAGVSYPGTNPEQTGALPLNPAPITLVGDLVFHLQLRIARRADQIALLAPRINDRDCWLSAEHEILGSSELVAPENNAGRESGRTVPTPAGCSV